MARSVEDVARDAAPALAELIRKYPPRRPTASPRSARAEATDMPKDAA